jgi:hypothetical protein
MRKMISLALLATLLAPVPTASAQGTVKVRNCVNLKTEAARLISDKVLKCKKTEKLLTLELPDPAPVNGVDGTAILSGTTDPLASQGKLGDFYFDTKFRWVYGPKTETGWGTGFPMAYSSGGGGAKGDTGAAGADGFIPKWGWFYDLSDESTTVGTVTPIHNNTVGDNSHGVTFDNTTGGIAVNTAGTYNIAFSSQVVNSDTNNGATISIWLQKKSGSGSWTNIDSTNTDVDIVKHDLSGRKVLAWNFFVPMTTTDQVRLVWQTTATTLYINYSAVSGSKPAIPSTILTVNQVG